MKMYEDKEQLLKVMSFIKPEDLSEVQQAQCTSILKYLISNTESNDKLNLAFATTEVNENDYNIADGCYSDSNYKLNFECEYPFIPQYHTANEIVDSNWYVEDNIKDTCQLEVKLVGAAEQIIGQLYVNVSCTDVKWCIKPTKFNTYSTARSVYVNAADILDATDLNEVFAEAKVKDEDITEKHETQLDYGEEITLSAAYNEAFILPT